MTEPFVVPHDVVLQPVRAMSMTLRRELDCDPDDFAVTRLNSRTPTRIVDEATAALMQRFRKATPIVEAVMAFSRETGRDPEETLVEAFPALQRLIGDGLLVPAVPGAEHATEASFSPGDELDDLRVVESIQVLDDSEVLRAMTADGVQVAVKIARPDTSGLDRLLAREAAVLRLLDGQCAPRLMAEGAFSGRSYIAVSWIDGVSIVQSSRALLISGDYGGALSLAENLVRSYARIHELGVLHGDVHPKNALVHADGQVKLIDFGLADCPSLPRRLRPRSRGGIGFFFEPEYAMARLAEEPAPRLSSQGEQYSVAALAYLVLTGSQYLRFSPEKEAMWHQIAEQSPETFASVGLQPRPALEAVLRRSLAKDPADRYASTTELATELAKAGRADRRNVNRRHADPFTTARDALIESVISKAQFPATWSATPPTASVTYGCAGLAYGLLRLARAREDPQLFALADQWSDHAIALASTEDAFTNSKLEIGPTTVGVSTPYHTVSGVHWVRALLSQAAADGVGFTEACALMPDSTPELSTNPDLTLGRSGTLLAYSTLIELKGTLPFAGTDAIEPLARQLASDLKGHLATQPPIGRAPTLAFLGIAHGWAGIIYALLRWLEVTRGRLDPPLVSRLDQLADLAEPHADGLRWRRTTGAHAPRSSNFLPSWCNGSAGFVHLWLAAERVSGDSQYRALALGAARDASGNVESGSDLCCGLAGRAYAMLAAFRATGDEEWLAGASDMCRRAILRPGLMSELFPLSLYKGSLGLAVVCAELARPDTASMPLFESEGWPTVERSADQSTRP